MFATERVTVSLSASPVLAAALGTAHAIAAAVPWTVGMPGWLALVTSIPILTLGVFTVARDALRRLPSSVIRIEFEADGQGRVVLRSGRTDHVRFGLDATVVPMAVVVRGVGQAGRTYGVVVTRDSCGAEAFRRLKVFLRWRLRPDAARADADTPSDR